MIFIKFEYKQTTKIQIEANSIQEAEQKIKAKKFTIVKQDQKLEHIITDNGMQMAYMLNDNFKKVYYQSACPLGYTDCILDPARQKAQHCHDSIMHDIVPQCTYHDDQSNCDMYDDENK